MTYTFWHAGILIGESDLEESDEPRRAGGFRPTAYGLEIFPRLSGVLSAGAVLEAHIEARGLNLDRLTESEIDELLETEGGQRMLDVGRVLSEVELRSPDGRRLEFASIAFMDMLEMRRVAGALRRDDAAELAELPPAEPRYVVSATLRGGGRESDRTRQPRRGGRRGAAADN